MYFCVDFGLINFISIDFNLNFCFYIRSIDFESELSDLQAESEVKIEDISYT